MQNWSIYKEIRKRDVFLREKAINEDHPEMTHILELADKAFKAAI